MCVENVIFSVWLCFHQCFTQKVRDPAICNKKTVNLKISALKLRFFLEFLINLLLNDTIIDVIIGSRFRLSQATQHHHRSTDRQDRLNLIFPVNSTAGLLYIHPIRVLLLNRQTSGCSWFRSASGALISQLRLALNIPSWQNKHPPLPARVLFTASCYGLSRRPSFHR